MRFLIFLLWPSLLLAYPSIPDSTHTFPHFCTKYDSDFSEFRYKDKIPHCKRNVSSALKSQVYDLYKIKEDERNQYTIDHLVPLSLGGSNSIYNLWPQHKDISTALLEGRIYREVNSGKETVYEGINEVLKVKYSK